MKYILSILIISMLVGTSLASIGSLGGGNGLTDSQLRASTVGVSMTSNIGAPFNDSIKTFPQSIYPYGATNWTFSVNSSTNAFDYVIHAGVNGKKNVLDYYLVSIGTGTVPATGATLKISSPGSGLAPRFDSIPAGAVINSTQEGKFQYESGIGGALWLSMNNASPATFRISGNGHTI
jgi:hypothetical protein